MKEKIIKKLLDMGLENHGFMTVKSLESSKAYFKERKDKGYDTSFEERDLEKKINLTSQMSNVKTIISVAFPYYFDSYLHAYLTHYSLGQIGY